MKGSKIGLALSGGGSRAIAFHLGCLRALDDLGVLKDVKVISTVSGGSVIGALYACHTGTFPEFETKVHQILSKGLFWPCIHKSFSTAEGLKTLINSIIQLIVKLLIFVITLLRKLISLLIPIDKFKRNSIRLDSLYVRRSASITTILQRVFNEIFENKSFQDISPYAPLLIVNAAELRSKSAFYFSQQSSGSWRFDRIADNSKISLAYAVTASAAYPLWLPAIDEHEVFLKKDGTLKKDRIVLTDGGVYDNLGLAPLWPDRDSKISLNVTSVDNIICCNAGYGLRLDPPTQFICSRLISVFSCIHERAQNAAMKRLFDLTNSKKLKGFLLPYLGQIDKNLKYPPKNLVSKEDVYTYGTNFFAMPSEWINRLSLRGEQITRALIAEHYPEILTPDINKKHQDRVVE